MAERILFLVRASFFETLFHIVFSLFPLIALGFLIALFFLPKQKKTAAALGFFLFSLLTYRVAIVPFLSQEITHKVFLDSSFSSHNEEILAKVAVINSYFSIGLDSDQFLENLWKDLSYQGFDSLIVCHIESFWVSQPKKSLRIFGKKNIFIRKLGSFITLITSQRQVVESQFSENTKIVWLDWERTFLSQSDLLKLDFYKFIYFPFSVKPIRWYDWFSQLNIHYIYFY